MWARSLSRRRLLDAASANLRGPSGAARGGVGGSPRSRGFAPTAHRCAPSSSFEGRASRSRRPSGDVFGSPALRWPRATLAVALYEELFTEAPDDPEAGAGLERLYRQRGRTADLVSLRERQIAVDPRAPRCVALRLDLAALLVAGGDKEGAITALRANLEGEPDAASLDMLCELYATGGHDADALRAPRGRAAMAEQAGDTKLAISAWTSAATVAEGRLVDTTRAIAAAPPSRRPSEQPRRTTRSLASSPIEATTQAPRPVPSIAFCDRLEATGPTTALAEAVLRLVDALRAAGRADVRARAARARREGGARGWPAPPRGSRRSCVRRASGAPSPRSTSRRTRARRPTASRASRAPPRGRRRSTSCGMPETPRPRSRSSKRRRS